MVSTFVAWIAELFEPNPFGFLDRCPTCRRMTDSLTGVQWKGTPVCADCAPAVQALRRRMSALQEKGVTRDAVKRGGEKHGRLLRFVRPISLDP